MRRVAISVVWLAAVAASAWPQQAGHAEIGAQGYYLGGSGAPVYAVSGGTGSFRYLLPRHGELSASVDGLHATEGLRFGENYLQLRGFPLLGRRWSFTGGDLRSQTVIGGLPNLSIQYPEMYIRGFEASAHEAAGSYRAFGGRQTLRAGQRVPFQLATPMWVAGATAERQLREDLSLRISAAHTGVEASDDEDGLIWFPGAVRLRWADNAGAQVVYARSEVFQAFAESGISRYRTDAPHSATRVRLNYVAGFNLNGERLGLRASYLRRSAGWSPQPGFPVADQRGPRVEARYRPAAGMELYVGGAMLENNLDGDPRLPTYRSRNATTGVSMALPAKVTTDLQYSRVGLQTHESGSKQWTRSGYSLIQGSLSKPAGRHTLRITARAFDSHGSATGNRMGTVEVEETYRTRRWVAGGAVRAQRSWEYGGARTSLFYRGMLQASAGAVSVSGSYEAGRDLLSETVFAANTVRSVNLGISVRRGKAWTVQVEAFRNELISTLNPQYIFLLQGRGVTPSYVLSDFERWNLYLRVARSFTWGPWIQRATGSGRLAEEVPLNGSVAGLVMEETLAGKTPAVGIPVVLDQNRVAYSDEKGYYEFPEVPEGAHSVMISPTELPADFDPGENGLMLLLVEARRTTRADLTVRRLTALFGTVASPDELELSGVLVRLEPGGRYTTTDEEGYFAFYNIPEGDYRVVLDASTLPAGARPEGELAVEAPVRHTGTKPVNFVIRSPQAVKPVRVVPVETLGPIADRVK